MDILFYTLDFSEKFILPPHSKTIGYISMNTAIELCGNGSFELVFYSEDLEEFAKAHPEGLYVIWGDFQGYMTDWQFKEKEKRLFGSHLNSVIHKEVFKPQRITKDDTVDNVLNNLIGKNDDNVNWINYDSYDGSEIIEYTTDKCMNADKFLQEYLPKGKMGYLIYAKDHKLYLKAIPPKENPLILSKNNLNVYEIQEDFSNKNIAYGGWYKKTEEDDGTTLETPTWEYIELSEKSGVYKQDVVLSASSPGAAKEEVNKYKKEHEFTCKTRNLKLGVDYNLGDVVRLQHKGTTVKKQVSSVSLWYEGATYHEEPTLVNWEE